ncbi:carboxymuconolactone decarboxylase family protein [Lapidilactobacillus mulanensis]|uniref:Carboxymuconolactone decarboxylase family protein n=1 Tax=Lapidilactobacillus mulanensis TaxID=2485999 RepID=A0ABW4DR04_9LACO|nr:carboxymuconolactone decarboxylase family protein [Lapidilactobacillus mulanensis]
MKNIIEEYPEVAKAFFALTQTLTETAALPNQEKELILIGMFTASGGLHGLTTHTQRFLKAGGNAQLALKTILLAIPVVGITKVTLSFNTVKEIIGEYANENY